MSLNHFFSQVKFLNLISNVAQDNRLSEEKQRTHLHPDVGTFILLRKGKDRKEQPAGHHLSILAVLQFLEEKPLCDLWICCMCSLFVKETSWAQ